MQEITLAEDTTVWLTETNEHLRLWREGLSLALDWRQREGEVRLETDTMTVIFKETSVEESDEAKSGIIIDYDNQGDIVSIEILDAKKRITQPTQIIYQFAEQGVASSH